MTKQELLQRLQNVQQLANCSKYLRLLKNPTKYLYAILHRIFIYPITRTEKLIETETFFGQALQIALPASTDIFLTKGKSHASEINLARFLINNLQPSHIFLDIGAHCGYFSTLASKLVGQNGKVIALEPTTKTFQLLSKNVQTSTNIIALQLAVSKNLDPVTFYEFPSRYGEYNTINMKQFENANWTKKWKPVPVEIQCITLDALCTKYNCLPHIIKIDVEGAENLVIEGGKEFLSKTNTTVIMEYVAPSRSNENHKQAAQILQSLNYTPHILLADATLLAIQNIDDYFAKNNLDSDNIVFLKK